MSIRNPRTRSSGPELVGLVIETVSSGPWTPDVLSGQILKESSYLFCPNLSLYFFESRNDFWIEMNFLRDSIRNWFGQLIRLPVTSKEKVKAWRHFTRREKSLWRHRHFFPNIYLRKKPRESNWPKALEKPFKETIIIYWKKNISN